MTRFTGVHLLRDPLDYLEEAGVTVEHAAPSRGGVIEQVVARTG